MANDQSAKPLQSGSVTDINNQINYEQDQKKIPTETQLSQITASLNRQFLISDFKALYNAQINNDANSITQ